MNTRRLAGLLLSVLALSCAQDGGPVLVDAQWSLSCPTGGGSNCGSWALDSCIGAGSARAIVGEHGQPECGDRIIAICEAVERTGGMEDITLEANVDRNGGSTPRFAFDLSVKINRSDDTVELCNITVTEDEVPYDVGACGEDPPSMAQPCQLSNISTEGNEVVFDLQCESLFSSVTGLALNVGAPGGGPTTIQFANCRGF